MQKKKIIKPLTVVLSTIVVIAFLLSCEQRNKKESEITIVKSSIDSIKINRSIKNGVNKTFYVDESLKSTVEYSKGRKKGIEKVFYSDGSIKEKHHYLNGVLFGDQYWFNKNGEYLQYHFNDIEGSTVFTLNYQKGKYSGRSIYHIYNKSHLTTKEAYESLFYLAIPNGWQHRFLYQEIYKGDKRDIFDRDQLDNMHKRLEYAHVYSIDRKFEAPGIYRIKAKVHLIDTANNRIINDSILSIVTVK